MKKLAPVVAALIVCAVGAGPAAAAPKQARFIATFEGQRTVKWDIPRWAPPSDCYHQRYQYGDGDEIWKIKSRATKLLAVQGGKDIALIKIGTFSFTEASPEIGLPASGKIDRRYDVINGWNPGSCGGEQTTEPPRKTDCGTRLPKHSIVLQFTGKTVLPEAIDAPDNMAPGFDTCTLLQPAKISAGSWPRVAGKLKVRDLFGKKKALTAKGSDSWSDTGSIANGGTINRSASMSWTLTLTRVK